MNNYNLFIVISSIVIAVIAMTLSNRSKVVEEFTNRQGHYCRTCNNKSMNNCLECYNCGFYKQKNQNYGRCVAGGVYGPEGSDRYQRSLSGMWYHGDPYSRQLWYEKCRRSKPYI